MTDGGFTKERLTIPDFAATIDPPQDFINSYMDKDPLELIRLLLARLERISADSYWAHRASGVRGSLLRVLEKLEAGRPVQTSRLDVLMANGFDILEKAAIEKSS
jgi:hypothetical protein